MSEFSELIKRFDKIRSYVRDFYVYGFKTREDYAVNNVSGRTYDNERRRIESWFQEYVDSVYDSDKRKSLALTIDSSQISINPLFAAWKSKSFTSNDIMLHFFLLDTMSDGIFRNADQATDAIAERFHQLFESQTVRKKLVEYTDLGIFTSKKEGRTLLYGMDEMEETVENAEELLVTAASFFQGASPFGFVGSTILDHYETDNDLFRMKHDFLVHTLEDEILYPLLEAMKNHSLISVEYKGSKTGALLITEGAPLKILVSTQTGRRYLCLKNQNKKQYLTLRLDFIQSVKVLSKLPDYELYEKEFQEKVPYCWGASFGNSEKLESICFTVEVDEKTEDYIINRLEREGRHGTVTRLEEGVYQFEGTFFDCNELLPWVKTFTGRILSFSCSNQLITQKFNRDMERMSRLYQEDTNEA